MPAEVRPVRAAPANVKVEVRARALALATAGRQIPKAAVVLQAGARLGEAARVETAMRKAAGRVPGCRFALAATAVERRCAPGSGNGVQWFAVAWRPKTMS